jgi:hypothetical protein
MTLERNNQEVSGRNVIHNPGDYSQRHSDDPGSGKISKETKRKDSSASSGSSESDSVSSDDSEKLEFNPFPPRFFKKPAFTDICKFVQQRVNLKKLIQKHVLPHIKK